MMSVETLKATGAALDRKSAIPRAASVEMNIFRATDVSARTTADVQASNSTSFAALCIAFA